MIRRLDRIFLGCFLAGGCTLLALGFAAYKSAVGYVESNRWVQHTYKLLDQLAVATSRLRDAEADKRGYLLTNDDSYLRRYKASVAKIEPEIAQLIELTSDNPPQQERLRRFAILVRIRVQTLQEGIDLFITKGIEQASNSIRTNHGLEIMTKALNLAKEIETEERSLLEAPTNGVVRRLGVRPRLSWCFRYLLR